MGEPEKIFDKINSYQRVKDLIGKESESLFLEFKEAYNNDARHKDNADNYAKALSGFANASGGVLIWGIKAKKGLAQELKPFSEFKQYEADLQDLAGGWVFPSIDGLQVKSIESEDDPGRGFVLVLIPVSDKTPHINQREHRYYYRNGSNFLMMEHYQIDDMFGRRPKPKLDLIIHIKRDKVNDNYNLNVSIQNKGKATAKEVICKKKFFYSSEIPKPFIDGNITDLIEFYDGTQSWILKKPVHPNTIVKYRDYNINCTESYEKINFEIYCENLPITRIVKFLGLRTDNLFLQNNISEFPFAFDIKEVEKYFQQSFINNNPNLFEENNPNILH